MANRTVNAGLNRVADTASQTSGYSASRFIRTMSFDDSSNGFVSTDTALNSGGAVANQYDQAFDGTPTRSGQIVTHLCTIPVGSGNFTIRRVSLHDDTAASVTTSSTTLVAGIDGQSFTKTSDFTMQFTVTLTYSNV